MENMRQYIDKLKSYIHNKTTIYSWDSIISFGDVETPTEFNYQEKSIVNKEREKVWSKIVFYTLESAKKYFAQLVKEGYDCEINPTDDIQYFRSLNVNTFVEAQKYYKELLPDEYYAINNPSHGKLNLTEGENQRFTIFYYGFNGRKNFFNKYVYENGTVVEKPYEDDPEVFSEFYSAVNLLRMNVSLEKQYEAFWGSDGRPWEEIQDSLMIPSKTPEYERII